MELLTKNQITKITKLMAFDEKIEVKFKNFILSDTYAETYNRCIYYDYEGIINKSIKEIGNNNNIINFILLQTLGHEITHIEYKSINPKLRSNEDAINTHEENIMKSITFYENNDCSKGRGYGCLIDEYYAEINGHLKALEFLINNNPYDMAEKDFREINKYIAKSIIWIYEDEDGKPMIPFTLHNDMINYESKTSIRIRRALLLQISLKDLVIKSIDYEKKYKLVMPDLKDSYNSEFDKLFYGIDTSLLNTIKDISEGKIETINIFDMLNKIDVKKSK